MIKGMMVILAIGAAFIYFSINMYNTAAEENDEVRWAGDPQGRYSQYYREDVTGDPVLDLNSLSMDRAKAIWKEVGTREAILSTLPDFELAKTEAANQIAEGPFRNKVIDTLKRLQEKFLTGEITLEQARTQLTNLN